MPNPFTAHPRSVGETYLAHMASALRVWFWLALSATLVFIHAFLPFLFPTTASGILKRLLQQRDDPGRGDPRLREKAEG